MKKAIAAFIAAALGLLTGCSVIEIIPDEVPASIADTVPAVTVPRDQIFSSILRCIEDNSNKCVFDGVALIDDVDWAVSEIEHSHPEYFWMNGYASGTANNSYSDFTLTVLNNYSADEQRTMLSELRSAADNIIAGIPAGLDDGGKVIYIHDRLVLDTVYDDEGAAAHMNGIWGTAYGCLVNKKAVCQGYAEAFLYLMNRLGIEAGLVSGETAEGGHAWNYVNVGGRYYWIDVTWDDPDDGVQGTPLLHTYCLIDDQRLLRTRTIDDKQYFLPSCFSMDANYFVRHGSYITDYSEELLGQIMVNAETYGADDPYNEVEVMFDTEEMYRDALNRLFNEDHLWDLDEYISIHETVNYSTDDNLYVLKIVY